MIERDVRTMHSLLFDSLLYQMYIFYIFNGCHSSWVRPTGFFASRRLSLVFIQIVDSQIISPFSVWRIIRQTLTFLLSLSRSLLHLVLLEL